MNATYVVAAVGLVALAAVGLVVGASANTETMPHDHTKYTTVLDGLKSQMLDMINEHRSRAGLGNVTLGDNVAAQLHAEDMKKNCYLSHWSLNGTMPNIRYAMAGGHQHNAENISGHMRCYGSGYATASPESQLQESMNGLINSPGHRTNILDPHHVAVNLGIAYDSRSMWIVQQFEYGYAAFDELPRLENGVLSFDVTAINITDFDSDSISVTIYYSPYPREYTREQVNRTHCYDVGDTVALVRPPPPPGSYYPSNMITITGSSCPGPDTPKSYAHTIKHYMSTVQWYDADTWRVDGERFRLDVNLEPVLDKHGAGAYTVLIWANSILMAGYPILYSGSG